MMINLPQVFVRIADSYINLSHVSQVEVVTAPQPQLRLWLGPRYIIAENEDAVNLLAWINDKYLAGIPQAKTVPVDHEDWGDVDMDI